MGLRVGKGLLRDIELFVLSIERCESNRMPKGIKIRRAFRPRKFLHWQRHIERHVHVIIVLD